MACYRFIQKLIATYKPWPIASESGDPGAGDDDFEELLDAAWSNALEFLDLDPDDVEDRTTEESNLVGLIFRLYLIY